MKKQHKTSFVGIKRLYGHQQFDWLQQAHFCVIGIGGVGSR